MRSAPPEAVARFESDVAKLIDGARGRVGVAVSGGADSLALLLLAHAAFPNRCHAATVDHGLRPESTEEAARVATLCAEIEVPHQTLSISEPPRGNVSDWARRVRYRALDSWADGNGLPVIMTAHHADDQLETVLMRLNRSSGVAGLAGIRAKQGRIVRPLLGWRRAELTEIVAMAGIPPVHDPSNSDDRYDRARLRKSLASADWLDPIAAGASAAALAEAEDSLEWASFRYFNRRTVIANGVVNLDAAHLPAELRRRLVVRCLKSINPAAAPRGADLARLMTSLSAGRQATLAGVQCRGGETWRFAPAPLRRGN